MRHRGGGAPAQASVAAINSVGTVALVVAELGAHRVDGARELATLRLLDALRNALCRARLFGVRGWGEGLG